VVDLARITGFEWDAGNRGKNLRHSVSDMEAEQVFFGVPLLILIDGCGFHACRPLIPAHAGPAFHAMPGRG